MRQLPWILVLLAGCGGAPRPWSPGELLVEAVGVGPDARGNVTLVVGPDGTSALVDLGNDANAETLRAEVVRQTGAAAVAWIVVTVYQADHMGGADDVLGGADDERIDVETVVTRGTVDLTRGELDAGEWADLCAERDDRFVDLCTGGADACAPEGTPATGCPGLLGEAGLGDPPRLELGDGAVLELFAADGYVRTDDGLTQVEDLGGGATAEQARSVAGVVRWGAFSYVFGGDLTGGGGAPDVESVVAAAVPEAIVPASGASVLRLNAHGGEVGNNAAWLARMLPEDGRARNAITGASDPTAPEPSPVVVDTVLGRLGGGSVWATSVGEGGADDVRRAPDGVVVRVVDAGDRYTIEADGTSEPFDAAGTP